MAESITPELELKLLQLMLRLRSVGSPPAITACDSLRARIRRTLLAAPSHDDAVHECEKLLRRFVRKADELDGTADEARDRKRARQEKRKKGAAAFLDTEAGEGEESDKDDDELNLEEE